jgi:hypothetical protein
MRKLFALFMCGAVASAVALSAGGCGSSSNSVGPGSDSGSDAHTGDAKTDGPVTGDGGKDSSSDGATDAGCVSFPQFVLNQIKTTKADSTPVAIPTGLCTDSGPLIPSGSL